MSNLARAETMLATLYESIRVNDDSCRKIRNWCVTTWLAALAFVTLESDHVSPLQGIMFPVAPILVFWVLESFQNTFSHLYSKLALSLEKKIVSGAEIEPQDVYLSIAYEAIPWKAKVYGFFHCLFTKETVFFFYILLLFVSLMFILTQPV